MSKKGYIYKINQNLLILSSEQIGRKQPVAIVSGEYPVALATRQRDRHYPEAKISVVSKFV